MDYCEDNNSISDTTDGKNTENESVDEEVDGETQPDNVDKKRRRSFTYAFKCEVRNEFNHGLLKYTFVQWWN